MSSVACTEHGGTRKAGPCTTFAELLFVESLGGEWLALVEAAAAPLTQR